jgi:hypothetical protein
MRQEQIPVWLQHLLNYAPSGHLGLNFAHHADDVRIES